MFETAQLAKPCIIFFDEMEALFGDREESSLPAAQLVAEMLVIMGERLTPLGIMGPFESYPLSTHSTCWGGNYGPNVKNLKN